MSTSEKEEWIETLDYVTTSIEDDVSNWALDGVEDLHDIEDDTIVRALFWSRGMKEFPIVITPCGMIKWFHPNTPRELLVQVSNSSIAACIRAMEDSEY